MPDGLTNTILNEVKNVGRLAYTQQLRDYAQCAADTGRAFQLWVRGGTVLSPQLQNAVRTGEVTLRTIPTVTP